MHNTLSLEPDLGDETLFESLDNLYDRGLKIPKGEWTEHLIMEFFNYRYKQEPAPLDILVGLQSAGIIVDEFERFIDGRLALASRINSRHIAIN